MTASSPPRRHFLRQASKLAAAAAPATLLGARPAQANVSGERSLSMVHTHTRERLSVVYAIDQLYPEPALAALNRFLRDHYTGQVGQMDPALFELLHRTRLPLIVMGDLNDSPHSVTTQLIAATSQAAYDKGARDSALYSAWDVQGEGALRRDVAFSHIHQGYPEVLDQVLVSEEFVATSRRAIGDVRRVEVFNDHLFEGRDRSRSDHGFVRALLRMRLD